MAPDLNRISRKHDVLTQYSNPDYLLGGSTDQALQDMACRLQLGEPEPKVKSSELPGDLKFSHELAESGTAPERAPSRYIPSSNEPLRELDGRPIFELEGAASRPQRPIQFTDLTPTEATSEISSKISEDLANTEAPSDSNKGCNIQDLSDDLFDLYYY